jgi:uncharacterized membrane protein YhhN
MIQHYAIILLVAAILLAGLLFFEKKESTKGLLSVKPLLSLLFIIAALLQTHLNMTYFYIVFAGLVLCLIGDVCLIFFFNKKVFTAGLGAFLAGHILYTIAFFTCGTPGTVMWVTAASCLALSIGVFSWLKPNLGTMLGPVIAYIVIITAMAIGASALKSNPMLDMTGKILVYAGALLFYVSDIFVARHRFVKREFINRVIGLPLYYTAQFMIAFSTGLI